MRAGSARSSATLTAVDGIDFDVQRGEAFGFLGPNGAGKSSTMRMIGCVSPPTGGTLRILDLDPVHDGPKIRAPPRRRAAGGHARPRAHRPREPDHLRPLLRALAEGASRERADELLEFVQLSERANERVEPLSGGMKRRLTIARALVNEPEVLLLDEPTTGLDPQARHVVWDRLFRLKQQGVTLVLTTHYMDEAEQLCDRLVVMDRGTIAEEGSPLELIRGSRRARSSSSASRDEPPHVDEQTFDGQVARIEELPDRVLLYTDDGDALVPVAHERLHPQSVLVRRSTLEDVFLRLTGRTLVD